MLSNSPFTKLSGGDLTKHEVCEDNCLRLLGMTGVTKEYILVIEGTAPTIVLQRCDSPNLSMPALSVYCSADRAGRGWVSHILVRRWPVLFLSITNIYSLGVTIAEEEHCRVRQSNESKASKCRKKISLIFTFYVLCVCLKGFVNN